MVEAHRIKEYEIDFLPAGKEDYEDMAREYYLSELTQEGALQAWVDHGRAPRIIGLHTGRFWLVIPPHNATVESRLN